MAWYWLLIVVVGPPLAVGQYLLVTYMAVVYFDRSIDREED